MIDRRSIMFAMAMPIVLLLADVSAAQVIVPDRGRRQVFRYLSTYSGSSEFGPPLLGFSPVNRLFHNRSYYRGPASYYALDVGVRIISLHEMDEQILNSMKGVSKGSVAGVQSAVPQNSSEGSKYAKKLTTLQRYLRGASGR